MRTLMTNEEWADYISRLKMYRYEARGAPEMSFDVPASAERAARMAAEALFADCGVARDAAGYIGTVPDCIADLTKRLREAESALSTGVNRGLEKAAAWHDQRAADWRRGGVEHRARECEADAASIRALKSK